LSDFHFDGEVAIVTGAGGGLGRTYALLLASRGARVVVNDASESAHAVVEEIKAAGGEAVASIRAVGSAEAGAAICADAVAAFGGRIEIVINNAGIVRDKSFHNMTPEQFELILDVHLRGAYYLTQPVYQRMREQGYGRIVNTTSPAGVYGNFGQANYSSAKMGLVGFTRTIAVEGAKANIKANVISPGAETAMTAGLVPEGFSLPAESVAPIVAWLSHRDCPWSGEIVTAAGGRFARVFTGETRGVYIDDPTIEAVAANADAIADLEGFSIYKSLYESNDVLLELRKGR
jgi:NAD(P)-dependent dehydrogenase (short-subunit alcohol dehydrogenase family)